MPVTVVIDPALLRRVWFVSLACAVWCCVTPRLAASSNAEPTTLIVVVGAPGESAYQENFVSWGEQWKRAGEKANARIKSIGFDAANTNQVDLEQLKKVLAAEPTETTADLWLVLIGHGTFDGKEARFNLRGPDLLATDLADLVRPLRRPLAIVNTSSASAPFLNKLSAEGRVVIAATRSGAEHNYARFGNYMASAIADPAADLDKDGQTSLLEAYLAASRRVAEFYELEGRLATEHALLDDNGDGLGTPADWFNGIRAVKKAKDGATADGFRAHQFHLVRTTAEQQLPSELRKRRDGLELALTRLRDKKKEMEETDYYQKLEPLLLELARLYGTQNQTDSK